MSFRECIRRAVEAGKAKKERADEALKRYDELLAAHQAKGIDAAEAERLASNTATAILEQDTIRRKITAARNAEVTSRILRDLSGQKDWNRAAVDLWEKSGTLNYSARRNTILGQAQALFQEALEKYAPKVAGIVRPVRDLENVLLELFGKKTGDDVSALIAQSWKETSDFLYNRAVAAGADIAKREDWRLPNSHNAARIMKDSADDWASFTKPLLDWEAMQKDTGQDLFTDELRQASLVEVRTTLVQDGANKVTPSLRGQGTGSLATRMGAHRYLVFKDAESWLAYHKRYGDGSIFDVMTGHISKMSHEIAMLETFGPNPNATRVWLKSVLTQKASELDKAAGGRKNLLAATKAGIVFDRIYDAVTGANHVLRESIPAQVLAGVRDTLVSAYLGSASISALTGDLFTKAHWRVMARLPMAKTGLSYLKLMSPAAAADRQIAVRSGFLFESALHANAGDVRWFGEMTGPQVTKRISDTVMRASLLNRHTETIRWAFMSEFTAMMAEQAGKSLDAVDPGLRDLFKKHNVTPSQWDLLRGMSPFEQGRVKLLRPNDLRTAGDTPEGRFANATADRFMDMIFSERDNAIMSSSLEARAALVGEAKSGTFIGEAVNSVAMFKNFPVTLMQVHLRRMLERQTTGGRLAYAGTFLAGMTVMGALAYEVRQVSQGKDPVPLFGDKWRQVWGQAALQGGGLGLLGDFLFRDTNRFGGGVAQTLAGPVASFAADTIKLTVGNALEAANGDDTHLARELVQYTRRNLPGANLWWARLALQRGLFDWLQIQADPEAYSRFARQVRDWRTDYDSDYWWPPGESAPTRAPDLANAVK